MYHLVFQIEFFYPLNETLQWFSLNREHLSIQLKNGVDGWYTNKNNIQRVRRVKTELLVEIKI